MLGLEYTKTVGHYHPQIPGTDISYPEIYQVLEGSATYLLQKVEHENEDVLLDVVEMCIRDRLFIRRKLA